MLVGEVAQCVAVAVALAEMKRANGLLGTFIACRSHFTRSFSVSPLHRCRVVWLFRYFVIGAVNLISRGACQFITRQ